MRSDKQIEASRRNGALSRGPLSIDGKAAFARNATTDGLSAYDVLLRQESLEQFEQLLQTIQTNIARFAPQDDTEHRIVEEYSVAGWRLRRAWTLIAALIDNRMDAMAANLDQTYQELDHATRAALAHDYAPAVSMSLRELENHVSRYSRATDRAIRRLQQLRQFHPTPPSPRKTVSKCILWETNPRGV